MLNKIFYQSLIFMHMIVTHVMLKPTKNFQEHILLHKACVLNYWVILLLPICLAQEKIQSLLSVLFQGPFSAKLLFSNKSSIGVDIYFSLSDFF